MNFIVQQITVELEDHIIINGLRERRWRRSISGEVRLEADANGNIIGKGNWDVVNETLRDQVRKLVEKDMVTDLHYLVSRGAITQEQMRESLRALGIGDSNGNHS